MCQLTGAEFKVLVYICRRTFGFRRYSDAISIEQFRSGLVRHDGKPLDNGTGLSNRVVVEAVARLEELGLIKAQKRRGADGRNDVTVYTLTLRELDESLTQVTKSHMEPSDFSDKSQVTKSHNKKDMQLERQAVEAPTPTNIQTSWNLTGTLGIVIDRHCRRLGVHGKRMSDAQLRQFEREDSGEDFRRAMVESLERFASGNSRDTIGQWAYDFLQAWRLEATTGPGTPGPGTPGNAIPGDSLDRKCTLVELQARHRERERRDHRQAWRGNGTSAYHQAQLDDKARMLASMATYYGVDLEADK